MKSKYFEGPRGRIHYLHSSPNGHHKPLLHFAHATGFNAFTYRSLLERLSTTYEVYAIDLRGHGQNYCQADPKKFKNWQVYSEDLYDFLKSFNKPWILSGHSLGSLVSLSIAAKYPDLVKGMILCEPVILAPYQNSFFRIIKMLGLGHHLGLAIQAKNRRYVWESKEQVFKAYKNRGAFASWPDQFLCDYIEGGVVKDPNNQSFKLACHPEWESRSFALTSTSTWKYFKKIYCPISLLYGEQKSTISPVVAKKIKKLFPQFNLIKYDQASHFLPMEFPDQFVNDLEKFLECI